MNPDIAQYIGSSPLEGQITLLVIALFCVVLAVVLAYVFVLHRYRKAIKRWLRNWLND